MTIREALNSSSASNGLATTIEDTEPGRDREPYFKQQNLTGIQIHEDGRGTLVGYTKFGNVIHENLAKGRLAHVSRPNNQDSRLVLFLVQLHESVE